jgi:hypothetical protein
MEAKYKRTRKDLILDIIIYGSLIAILVWTLLKVFGVFNTPAIVEALPTIFGVIAGLGVVYKFGQDVGTLKSDMKNVKKELLTIDERLTSLEV